MRMSSVLPADAEGEPGRSADRLAPADAARRDDPPVGAGIYSWLPLGLRVLNKVEQIVREEQDRAGAQEILMPTIQPADLWRESGRYDDYGKEMLRIKDRHDREMLYGPTNEELITDIFRAGVKSYSDLPKNLYHIQWKFRDEVRPRFGVMRGREFLMKDAYSFDLDEAGAQAVLQQDVRRLSADLRADGAEGDPDARRYRADRRRPQPRVHHPRRDRRERRSFATSDCARHRHPGRGHRLRRRPAADLRRSGPASTPRPTRCTTPTRFAAKSRRTSSCRPRGIEVGHIFYFGTKYSEPMEAVVAGPDGEQVALEMGSYGIGVSRLVGAVIEANHDEAGIIWPEASRPSRSAIVNLQARRRRGAARLRASSTPSCGQPASRRSTTTATTAPGAKFADMDLIGLPWQLIVGPQGRRRRQDRAQEPQDRRAPGRCRSSRLSRGFG